MTFIWPPFRPPLYVSYVPCIIDVYPSRPPPQASVVLLPLLQSARPEVSRAAAGVLTLLVVDNLPHVLK